MFLANKVAAGVSVRCKGQLVAQDTTARSGDTTRSGDTALAGDTTGPRLGHALTPTTLKLLTSLFEDDEQSKMDRSSITRDMERSSLSSEST